MVMGTRSAPGICVEPMGLQLPTAFHRRAVALSMPTIQPSHAPFTNHPFLLKGEGIRSASLQTRVNMGMPMAVLRIGVSICMTFNSCFPGM